MLSAQNQACTPLAFPKQIFFFYQRIDTNKKQYMQNKKWFHYNVAITCLGLAPPRRTSNKVAHKLSVCGNLNNLSAMAEKIGCILKLIFLWFSESALDLPTARLKNLGPFFSDGRPTKSLPRNCKLSNLIGSESLLMTTQKLSDMRIKQYPAS